MDDFPGYDGAGAGQGGVSAVEDAIASIADGAGAYAHAPQPPQGPKLKNLTSGEAAYADWLRDKSPERMSAVLDALAPTINSEITRYSGPKPLLRSRARVLAVKAVKTFNPMSGAKLNSWVVTNLKQLSRYSVKQRDVSVPEVAARQAAAVDAAAKELADELGRDPTDAELADETGLSEKRVRDVRAKAVASVNAGRFDEAADEDSSAVPAVSGPDRVGFAVEAVYGDLSPADRMIFDSATGSHGSPVLPAVEVARRLGVSPAAVSQRAKAISSWITYVVDNA